MLLPSHKREIEGTVKGKNKQPQAQLGEKKMFNRKISNWDEIARRERIIRK